MRLHIIWLVVLGMCIHFGYVAVAANNDWQSNERNKDALLRDLVPALNSAGGAGRLYYTAICHGQRRHPVPFPRIQTQPPTKGKMGVAAVQSVFGPDTNAVVVQDKTGIVRIRIGNPVSAILQTRIPSLKLKPLDRYNPGLAVAAIQNAKEVAAAVHKLGLEQPVIVTDMNVVEPTRGLPHLPSSLNDLTMDQALDVVAKTFKGVVSFGVCVDPNNSGMFTADFFEVVGWR